jgi:hypothetical protein
MAAAHKRNVRKTPEKVSRVAACSDVPHCLLNECCRLI